MLDKYDIKRNRVLMAKHKIPYSRFLNRFKERFPELKHNDATIANTLNCRSVNDDVLKHLECWAEEFEKEFKRSK